jgi:prepilin-type N-terminal cleavage/methylation domain-containing protein
MKSRRGFTLIELLMVIGLIGILMVALLPMITGASRKAEESDTRARLELLKQVIDAFANSPFGDFPPDDLRDLPSWKPLNLKPDATNTGIESCLIFLHRDDHRGKGLEDHIHDWLKNTDNDREQVILGKLGVMEKLELVDAWGTPIAYFHNRNYGQSQEYVGPDGATVRATAWKKEGAYIHPRGYQIFSAGLDQKFGTADDVSLFQRE